MRVEKLECLLDSFIASRNEIDTVDASPAGADRYYDCLNPLTHFDAYGGQFYFDGVNGGAIEPAVAAVLQAAEPVQSPEVYSVGRQLVQLAAQFSTNYPNSSSIRFEKTCIIVAPEEQTISIKIVRSNTSTDLNKTVTWKTVDKTAISNTHYVGSSGELKFKKNEKVKTIEIKILQFSDDAMDLRFNVEMSDVDGGFDPKPMTVSLKQLNNFYRGERQVVENLPISLPFTVEDIECVLKDSLTSRTFHMALTHLCSAADSVHLEFALALDLSRLCMKHLRRESVLNVLKDFFRMEDIDH